MLSLLPCNSVFVLNSRTRPPHLFLQTSQVRLGVHKNEQQIISPQCRSNGSFIAENAGLEILEQRF